MKFCRLADDELNTAQPIFRAAFGHEISARLLVWKYAKGRGESWVVCDDDGRQLCHGGVMFRPVIFAGKRFQASHVVDIAAMPKRSGLNRESSAYPQLLSYLSRRAWRGDNSIGLTFGFLSDRATRLGAYLGVLHQIDRFVNLRIPARLRPRFAPVCEESSHVPSEAVFARLWAAMSHGLDGVALGVRDLAYLSWRFIHHPEFHYRLVNLRSFLTRRIVGLAVVRVDDEICQLSDIIAPPAALPELIPVLAAWSAGEGCKELHFSITEHFAFALSPVVASECNPLGISIVVSALMPKDEIERFRNTFWLVAGDTDYR